MNTAIDDLKSYLEIHLSFLNQEYVNRIIMDINKRYKLKERQQIVKAVNDTYESCQKLEYGKMQTPIDGNDYYNHFYYDNEL